MRRRGRLFFAALCLTAALMLCFTGAFAAEDPALYIEGSAALGSVYQVFFRSTSEETPTAETLSILADGQPVAVQSVHTYDYVDAGTSYVILTDGRTSVIERALRDIREIANWIAGSRSSKDNIYIAQIGEEMNLNGFMDDDAAIAERIKAISGEASNDDLYQSVADALELLDTSPLVKARKCVVIIADGMDNSADGLSEFELTEMIRAHEIPICTIALTYGTANTERIAAAKTLSGFARLSGGMPILLGSDGVTTQRAAETVLSMRAQTYAAVLDSADVRAAAHGAEAAFSLSLKLSSGDVSAQRTLDISALPGAEAAPETAPETAPEPTPVPAVVTPEPAEPTAEPAEPETEAGAAMPGWLMWTLIAAAVVVAAAIVLTVLLLRRKKKMSGGSAIPRNTSVLQGGFSGPELAIVRMGQQEGVRFQLRMTQPLVIGRDPKQAQLVVDEDSQMAPVQCRLDWQGGRLIVAELSPAGGTLLNGVPVNNGTAVRTGDVLHIGSCDYRIFWEKA